MMQKLHDTFIFAISDSESVGVPLDVIKHIDQKTFRKYIQYQALYHERLTVLHIHLRTMPKEQNADRNMQPILTKWSSNK